MAPHSSTFAWKIPWMEEPGRLQYVGLLESDKTERLHFHFSLSCTGEGNGNPLQCSCLENPRDGKPSGLPSMGSHRDGHNWSNLAAAAAALLIAQACLWLIPFQFLMSKTAFVFAFAGSRILGCHIFPPWELKYSCSTVLFFLARLQMKNLCHAIFVPLYIMYHFFLFYLIFSLYHWG